MNHCIVVPAIHRENTFEFMSTLGYDAVHRLILIDNTDSGEIFDDHPLVLHRRLARKNMGVAAAWNYGVDVALNEYDATYVTLCSTSVRFSDGADALCRTADTAVENDQWVYGFETLVGWKCITLGRATFDAVGVFDEAFWPAYFEDNDYIWRMRCAGILEPRGGKRMHRLLPWVGALDPEVIEHAHSVKHAGVEVNFEALRAYYAKKWGGPPGEETTCQPLT